MYLLENQVRFGLRFGSRDDDSGIAMDPVLLQDIALIQNTHYIVPICSVTFNDVFNVNHNSGVFGDGYPFFLDLGPQDKDEDVPRDSQFRVFGSPRQTVSPKGPVTTLNGILNNQVWFRQLATRSFRGTSSEVIQQIAQLAELDAEVDPTNDSQVWLPSNRSWGSHALNIANHGWADEESLMMVALTEKLRGEQAERSTAVPWQVRYKNLTMINAQEEPVAKFTDRVSTENSGQDNEFQILSYDPVISSGVLNNWIGYRSRIGQEGLDGQYDEFDQVTVNRSTSFLEMNREARQESDFTRREVHPFDCGNTHDQFVQAYYQNRRLRATYSVNLYVFVRDYTGLRLFDPVEVEIFLPEGNSYSQVYNGRYLVGAKTQFVRGTFYREKLELVRQGVNLDQLQGRM